MRKNKRLTDEEKAYIREHAPKSTYAQVARELGRLSATVAEFARKNGIEYSKAAFRSIRGANFRNENSRAREARFKKQIQTRKEMFAKERRRIRWGMEQRTKMNVCSMPSKVKFARNNLKIRHNYVLEDCRFFSANPYNIYYDSETKRTPNEAYYAEKYGFKFIPLND